MKLRSLAAGWILATMASFVVAQPTPSPPAPPAPPDYSIKEHYTKYEYRIPMRDGKKLFTVVYQPKEQSKPFPFLMVRTPYDVGPYGVDYYPKRLGPSEDFDKAGYIYVVQDVRGRYQSEGVFVEMTPHKLAKKGNDVDESTDTFDTVEWLLKNVPNNNGKVCTYGISYQIGRAHV